MRASQKREYVFKLLYCNEFHSREEMPEKFKGFWDNKEYMNDEENLDELIGLSEKEKDEVNERAADIIMKLSFIDKKLDKKVRKWSVDRMSKVDLCILRLAYYEMRMDEEIDPKVAINEAVELAKKYGSDDSPSFVNGVLARFYKKD